MASNQDQDNMFGAAAVSLTRSFLWAAEDMATTVLQEFGTSSEPILIEDSQLNSLRSRLQRIQATLSDAEKLEIKDESSKLWLSELRELEYMAVDILEEFESSCRFHHLTVELTSSDCDAGKLTSFPATPDLSCLSRKLVEMNERFDEIAADRQNLRLDEVDGKRREEAAAWPPSSSLVDDVYLHGRQDDIDKVVKLLLSAEPYSVVSIVGMPGVGKTALAQHVYNNSNVKSCFQQRVWVCVSEDFDVMKITRAIIQGTMDCCCQKELDYLQQLVGKLLAHQRLLLVLDDVWNVNLGHWESLQKPLKLSAIGSRVILTSSNYNIARDMSTCKPYRLNSLSDDDCRLIYQSRALRGPGTDVPVVCDQSIKRLKGLPVAAKALGALMHSASLEECTGKYLADEHCYEVLDKILPGFKRSYNRLPGHLKRCFAYCSLFPRGYVFDKDQLIHLWIAQGFISGESSRAVDMEATGRKYFNELIGMSFFVGSELYDTSGERYVMHNLFHELASSISGMEYCRIEDYKLQEMHYKTRHTSIVPSSEHSKSTIQLEPFGGQALRTFLFVEMVNYKLMFNVAIADNFFSHLECMRVLDLRSTDIAWLPESIGRLKHLHYLSLENTRVTRLPESLCNLYKLQILDLKHCYQLEEIPQGIKHLLSLKHLELPSAEDSIVRMPAGIGKLTSLQTLPIFSIGNQDTHCKISELKQLIKLSRELQISGLQNVLNEQEAEDANLENKEKLQKLTLQWLNGWTSNIGSDSIQIAGLVLDRLRPHHSIQEINIKCYPGKTISMWLTDPIFSSLVSVNLQGCAECAELPPLGQLPSLRYLSIKMMNSVQYVGHEFCGKGEATMAFPTLVKLKFEEMYEWREWGGVTEADFPCLKSLIISSCPKLKELPLLSARTELQIHNSDQLTFVPESSSIQCLNMTDRLPKQVQNV